MSILTELFRKLRKESLHLQKTGNVKYFLTVQLDAVKDE